MSDLFSPITLNQLTIKNRFMRSATAERMADDDTGIPNDAYLQHYKTLAEGGVGLILTGHMYVHRAGKCHSEMTTIDHDAVLESFKPTIDVIHQNGTKVIPQINFGGLQCAKSVNPVNLSPSYFEDHGKDTAPNREMTVQEIEEIKTAFIKAAVRVKKAGFDGVMLHGAHGYFINQMLSPQVNRREDDWGGSFENRLRFLKETALEIREAIGPSFPMLIKLGLVDGNSEEGLSLEDGLKVLSQLESFGFDGVEISGGFRFNSIDVIRSTEDEAYFQEWAHKARQVTNLPILLVGGFRSLAIMENVLNSHDADMISLCRPLICEPDLINQFETHTKTKADCISCNRCFAQVMNEGTRCRWKYK